MAGKRAGYGRTLGDTAEDTIDQLTEDLSDTAVPRWNEEENEMVDSGLTVDEDNNDINTERNIRTSGEIESGTSTFRLGSAHSISSAGENVPFVNRVTGIAYHPTWQETTIGGDWDSLQRVPLTDIRADQVLQDDESSTVTNPQAEFSGLTISHRIYRATISPNTSQTNVRAVLFIQRDGQFVEYSRSVMFDVMGGQRVRFDLNPFIDMAANQTFRIDVMSEDGDVVLNGSNTQPFLLIDYRQYGDIPLAARRDLSRFRFRDRMDISTSTDITEDNDNTFNNNFLNVTATSSININFDNNLTDLEYFGIYVSGANGSAVLRSNVTPPATPMARFDGEETLTLTAGRGAIFLKTTENNYQNILNNFSSSNGVSTFLALTDTQSTFTANQYLRVNSDADAIEDGGTKDELTYWDHRNLPNGRLSSANRCWYTYTGAENRTVDLPLEANISSGWNCFIGNDSTTGTITVRGNFRGTLTSLPELPQQGFIVSYNGSIFLEGPSREVITISSFPDWDGNPMTHSTQYTGFSTNAVGLNAGIPAAIMALLNRTIRISTSATSDFVLDLPDLRPGNLAIIPIGRGYGVHANGPRSVRVRPSGTDSITRGIVTHSFSNFMRVNVGASVIFVRNGPSSWNVTSSTGSITTG